MSTIRSSTSLFQTVRPLLKWAGGKRQLLGELRHFYPRRFSTYYEPFLGSGAVYFDLLKSGRLLHSAKLSDTNADLVGCYKAVRNNLEDVVSALKVLEASHQDDSTGRYYYRVRDQKFNPLRQRLNGEYPASLAAMFIYLNRTGYNGLFRVNSRGGFNVPVGRFGQPRICNPGVLAEASKAFRRRGTTLRILPFSTAVRRASKGDFVYFDPPYVPLNATASFTAYTRLGFGVGDQLQLRDLVVTLARRGCHVTLSNSANDIVRELYSVESCRKSGLILYEVDARRAINCDGRSRGAIKEIIVSNVDPG